MAFPHPALPGCRRRFRPHWPDCRKLDTSAGARLDEAQRQRLAVITLLHDVGKANLGFQDKPFDKTLHAGHIAELAVFFADADLRQRFVQALEAETLCGWLDPPESVLGFLAAAWSHHGKPQVFDDTQAANHKTIAGYWQAKRWADDGAVCPPYTATLPT